MKKIIEFFKKKVIELFSVVLSFISVFFKKNKRFFAYLKNWKPKNRDSKKYINNFKEDEKFMESGGGSNFLIPAGYTYLGQFLGHELSFPIDIKNGKKRSSRIPKINLESIYGRGPFVDPIYYDQCKYAGRTHFILDEINLIIPDKQSCKIYDLARKDQGKLQIPIIPDGRNDENYILSQMHVALQLFHNKIVEVIICEKVNEKKTEFSNLLLNWKNEIAEENAFFFIENIIEEYWEVTQINLRIQSHLNPQYFTKKKSLEEFIGEIKESVDEKIQEEKDNTFIKNFFQKEIIQRIQIEKINIYEESFEIAQKQVRWHLQWVILKDYLPKVIGYKTLNKIITYKQNRIIQLHGFSLKFLRKNPFIPIEFLAAVFRFGHSMVKNGYRFTKRDIKAKILFDVKIPNCRIPDDLYLNWSQFFFLKDIPGKNLNFSRKINLYVQSNMIKKLPVIGISKNIIFRNLERARKTNLSSGQKIARMMGEIQIDSAYFLKKQKDVFELLKSMFPLKEEGAFHEFCDNSPLWFYILMEAHLEEGTNGQTGQHLGPVGGRIIAETILAILYGDKDSLLHQKNWKPKYFKDFPVTGETEEGMQGDNSMIALLKYAGIYNGAFVKPDKKDCADE